MIDAFAKDLDRALRTMHDEASTIYNDLRTGLADYGRHYRPKQKRPKPECCWSQRLAELFREYGYDAQAENAYPGQRKSCDNVIELDDGSKLWLEIKGAWKEYWRTRSEWMYRSYLLHPAVQGLDRRRTHTVPLDVKKLSTLGSADAQHLGILLIGFDSDEAPMDDDINELRSVSELGRRPWRLAGSNIWPEGNNDGCRVRYWFWHRSVARSRRSKR